MHMRWDDDDRFFPQGERYDAGMNDLFSVPLGYVGPDQGPDGEMSLQSVPPEAFEHRGKWVALRGGRLIAVADTWDELLEELGERRSEVSFFEVPATPSYAL